MDVVMWLFVQPLQYYDTSNNLLVKERLLADHLLFMFTNKWSLAPPGKYSWTCASSALSSPQPKWQIDQFSRFCTAHARKSLYFTIGDPFPKIVPSHGGSGPLSNWWLLGPVRAHNPNGIWISSAVFAQMTAKYTYTLQWDAPFPPQNCPFP